MTACEIFRYNPNDDEKLSTAVVGAVAKAHDENIIDQDWILSNDVNPDALNALFQDGHPDMTITFEADDSTVTIDIDSDENYTIIVESHR
jgi:predicted ATP-grasp superfamily ATP-dependent carboligase